VRGELARRQRARGAADKQDHSQRVAAAATLLAPAVATLPSLFAAPQARPRRHRPHSHLPLTAPSSPHRRSCAQFGALAQRVRANVEAMNDTQVPPS